MWEEKWSPCINIPVQAPFVNTAVLLELIAVPHLGASVKGKKTFTVIFQFNWLCFMPKGTQNFPPPDSSN